MSSLTYAAEMQFDQEVKVNHSWENLGEKQKQAVLTQSLRQFESADARVQTSYILKTTCFAAFIEYFWSLVSRLGKIHKNKRIFY